MSMNDTLSDMGTRIRNAYSANLANTNVIDSKLNRNVLEVLKRHGYIKSYAVNKEQRVVCVTLKYYDEKPCITAIKRISKPGCRVYKSIDALGRVFEGFGITILSTNKGVMSDVEARKKTVHQGGEILCEVI